MMPSGDRARIPATRGHAAIPLELSGMQSTIRINPPTIYLAVVIGVVRLWLTIPNPKQTRPV